MIEFHGEERPKAMHKRGDFEAGALVDINIDRKTPVRCTVVRCGVWPSAESVAAVRWVEVEFPDGTVRRIVRDRVVREVAPKVTRPRGRPAKRVAG